MEYEFTFVVAGVDVDDDSAVETLREQMDAMLARAGSLNLLTVAFDGDTAVQAALGAVSVAHATLPQLRVLRLDRDLVGIHEIADRTDRTRQNVAQWINGSRKSGGTPFPPPEGTAGRSQVWLWTEVNQWLAQHGLADDIAYPTREEMTEIDFAVANSMSLNFRAASDDPSFDLARDAVIERLRSNDITGFMNFLSSIDGGAGSGEHDLIVAAADEPARHVMERIGRIGHQSILVTMIDNSLVASVMSPRLPARPVSVVPVPHGTTVRTWMELLREHPHAAFAPVAEDEEPGGASGAIQRVLSIAA
ncbi:hypothetical protein [Kitasatospora sp. NPDC088351]|uniref:helix-turn-helix transcriptional regulator n=1 Tax=Kitasatospora sp. NPDC088351 TaxID=3155180 RepID=UPI00341BC3E0